MLIYDVKKDEFIDVKADSNYWEYAEKDTSDFFKAITKLYPECDLYISEWCHFGAGHFIQLSDEKTEEENNWQYRIEVVTDYNDKVCNITREHLAQFEQYERIGDDLDFYFDEIGYLEGKRDILQAKIRNLEGERNHQDEMNKLEEELDELQAEIGKLEEEQGDQSKKYKELSRSIRWD